MKQRIRHGLCWVQLCFLTWALHPARAAHDGVPSIMPDWHEDVESFWASHPYNPDSPDYDPDIASPTPIVDVPSGGSISNAINGLPAGGGTVRLAPGGIYSSASIRGRSNIHIICESDSNPARIRGFAYLQSSSLMSDYADFNVGVASRDPAYWAAFNDVKSNFYFKNIYFDGQGSVYYSMLIQRVADVLFDSCSFQNYAADAAHHRGVLCGHMGLRNVILRNCELNATSNAPPGFLYFDGTVACGMLFCQVNSGFRDGTYFFTNDDFSFDANENGINESYEMMNTHYDLFVGNVFEAQCSHIVQISGPNRLLVKDNVMNNYTNRAFVEVGDKSQGSINKTLVYEGYNLKVIGNSVNEIRPAGGSTGALYRIQRRQDPAYGDFHVYTTNSGEWGRSVVRNNTVGTCGVVYETYSGTAVDVAPNIIRDNRVNGSGSTNPSYTNTPPTLNATSAVPFSDVPRLENLPLTLNASDSDGEIVALEMYYDLGDERIVTNRSTPIADHCFVPWWAIQETGDHLVTVVITDDQGYMVKQDIAITVVENPDIDTYTQALTGGAHGLHIGPTVGATWDRIFTGVDTAGMNAALVTLTCRDIDDYEEARFFINGNAVTLPTKLHNDAGKSPTLSFSFPVDFSFIQNGTNTFTFEFNDNLGGTTSGWDISLMKLQLVAVEEQDPPVSYIDAHSRNWHDYR